MENMIDIVVPLLITAGAAISVFVMIDCQREVRQWIQLYRDDEESSNKIIDTAEDSR